MARPVPLQDGTETPGFKQQDASAWIFFDPEVTGHRKDVRSAAAKSSAAARKATIARKLALNTDCGGAQAQNTVSRPKKRRREQQDGSPVSATSSITISSRRQSEISLSSMASANSNASSGTVSPCLLQTPQTSVSMSWEPDALTFMQAKHFPAAADYTALQRAVSFALGIDTPVEETGAKDPTHFGASRIKSKAISNIHEAIAARRVGSDTLLAVALLAAWDLRFGDQRSAWLHLRAWHQLALPQNVLPAQDSLPPPNVNIAEAVRLSLQFHLPPDVYTETKSMMDRVPNPSSPQSASGREIVSFFDIIGELVATTGMP